MDAADIFALVRRMRSSGRRLGQLQAAQQLHEIFAGSTTDSRRGPGAAEQAAFAAAGGIEAAVQLLQTGTPTLRQTALKLLAGVCINNASCGEAVAAAGGVAAILSLLQPASSAGDLQPAEACWALGCVIESGSAAAQAAAGAGAADVLVQLLRDDLQQPSVLCNSAVPVLCNSAAASLVALAKLGEQQAAVITARGAISPLVQLLSACELDSPVALALMAALAHLYSGSRERIAAAVHAGLLPALVRCLSSPVVGAQHNAALLLNNLLLTCPQLARAAVIAAGDDSQLQRLLGSSRSDVRQRATQALASLADAAQQAPNQLL